MALRLSAYQQMANADDRRRPPDRVRGTQETDVNAQLQKQLDGFLKTQRRWQQEFEEKIERRLEGLRGVPPNREEGGQAARRTGRLVICYNCGLAGHIARRCPQPRRPAAQSEPMIPEAEVVTNHTTRQPTTKLTSNAIYIRATINQRSRMCLIDTGSEVSIVPCCDVEGMELQASARILLAANGTEIRVLGEVTMPLKITRGFEISTRFLVSDQIFEPMLGMDWLREHRCRIGFGTGAIFIGRRRISLVKGNGSTWCRRVVVAEEVVVSPRSQCDVPSRTLYGSLTATAPAWMTEASELSPGVHVARVLIRDDTNVTQVRVVNVGQQPATLSKDRVLGGLHPVQVVVEEEANEVREAEKDDPVVEELMKDLPTDVPVEAREKLKDLLKNNRDVSISAKETVGRTERDGN